MTHFFKLAFSFWTLSRAGAGLPPILRQALPRLWRWVLPKRHKTSAKNPAPLAMAFSKLGPTYIKLGQFLATRRDILDPAYVEDLSQLHDRLAPFEQSQAIKIIEQTFGAFPFTSFSEPIAAASVAQVHQATMDGKTYAVKLLRPNIKKRFTADIESLLWAAHKLERHLPQTQRLRPTAALKDLEAATLREMDLRLEAAAMAEIKENTRHFKDFAIPQAEWRWTKEEVLTMEWVEGIALSNLPAVRAAGHDLPKLAHTLMTSFLTTALNDGVFHADLHPGNLIVRADGTLVPIDFGIVGRLPQKDRRAMAWILRGLIEGDYDLAAREHIYAGYVKPTTDEKLFAAALRALGAPIKDRLAQDISMAELLWQLFETAGKFEMKTQPQLLLLQKTMVSAEGLARTLDPQFNIWEVSAPIVEKWIRLEYAPAQLLTQGLAGARQLLDHLPAILERAAASSREEAAHAAPPAAAPPRQKKTFWLALFWLSVGLAIGGALTKIYPNYLFFM